MQTIGVFFASRSPEHDVSIVTGQLIISELRKMRKSVVPVYLSKKGEWMLGEQIGSFKTFSSDQPLPHNLTEYYIDLEKSVGKMVFKKKGIFGKEITIDIAFPAFHGANGEDGTIQGLFEIFNIPYVGCDVTCSALTMDKVLTKLIFKSNDIPTPLFTYLTTEQWKNDKEKSLQNIEHTLQYPIFIKPARLGSSIGIIKVKNKLELEQAIEVGLHYDTKVLIEQGIQNLADLTVAVLSDDKPIASLIQESAFSKEFFSYEDKYLNDGGAQLGNAENKLKIPAEIDEKNTQEIRELAIKVFNIFECSGISRVDVLFDRVSQKYYVTEINTLPGTLYHHLWKKSGLELSEVITTLLDTAQKRYQQKARLIHTFESAILKQADSVKIKLKK